MADYNIIDISGQLPAADLHTRWRQRLPERYVKHLDSLKAHYEQVIAMRRTLNIIHDELHVDVGQLSPLTRRSGGRCNAIHQRCSRAIGMRAGQANAHAAPTMDRDRHSVLIGIIHDPATKKADGRCGHQRAIRSRANRIDCRQLTQTVMSG